MTTLRFTAPQTHRITICKFTYFLFNSLFFYYYSPSNVLHHIASLTNHSGNKVLIGITVFNIVFAIASKAYYMWRNSVREKKWNMMSTTEKEAYITSFNGAGGGTVNGARGGNKRLDFRFIH